MPARETSEASLERHVKRTLRGVNNPVSHPLGRNDLALKWFENDAKRELINGLQEESIRPPLARNLCADLAAVPIEQLLTALEIAIQKTVDFISGRPDEYLYGAPWYGKHTMGRMIQLNTSSPYANARTRLRKWKAQNDIA